MACNIEVDIAKLSVEDIANIVRKLAKTGNIPRKVTVSDLIRSLLLAGYDWREWSEKINIYITIRDFNIMLDELTLQGLKILYTQYNEHVDCIEVVHEKKPILVVCDEYEHAKRELKRIVSLKLSDLERFVKVKIHIKNYRGEHLINYVNITHIVRVERKIPVFYILNSISEEDIVLGFKVCLEREFFEFNDDAIAYSIMYYVKDLRKVDKAEYFTTDYVIRFLKDYIDNLVSGTRNGRVELYAEGRCLLKCVQLDTYMYKILYIDLIELLKHGVDVQLVKLG